MADTVEMNSSGAPSSTQSPSSAMSNPVGSTSGNSRGGTGLPRGAAPRELEVEVVARKMFYGGCALLPWLWLVNIIYFRQLYFAEDCPPGVRKCECRRNACVSQWK